MSASRRTVLTGLGALALTGCAPAPQIDPVSRSSGVPDVPVMGVHVHATLPHDPKAFTQGLELLQDGTVLESTGIYGESQVRVLDRATGEVLRKADLPEKHFGEGITVVEDTAYQLTWKEKVVHTWSVPSLEQTGTLELEGQGWGLCHDTDRNVLWRSDGSSRLSAHRPGDFSTADQELTVTVAGREVDQLNELEYAQGAIWANVWGTEHVLRIDPATGAVSAVVDVSHLRTLAAAMGLNGNDTNAVLNGIAFDPASGHMLMTGKLWPAMFEVSFVEGSNTASSSPSS